MSVIKNLRGKSSMDFVEYAGRIEEKTLDTCKKWPKTYTFLLTNRTVNLASELYEEVQKGNAIMVTTRAEADERMRHMLRALGALYAYAAKIELAYRKFPLGGQKDGGSKDLNKSDRLFEEIMDLCQTEEDALLGIIKSDRKRHENL